MKTIEVEAVFDSSDNVNLDQLEELGIEVSESERKEETDLITVRTKYIVTFYPTTNPNRIRLYMSGINGHFLINMSYKQFKELYHSAKSKEEIV